MNNEKLYALAGGINDDSVAETMKPKAARPRYLRYIAAAAAVLLVLGAAFGAVKAAGEKKPLDYSWDKLPKGYEFMADITVPKDAVLPKTQVGEFFAEASYARDYTIFEAYQESEAACIVSVKNWLGETASGTYYEVKLEKLYKGELSETFTLYQCANSEITMKGSPLFTYGDKLLVFLIPWNRDGYEGSYDLVGTDIAMFYVASSKDGCIYLIDHKGVFSNVNKQRCPDLELADYLNNDLLACELFDYVDSFDKAMADLFRNYREATTKYGDKVPLPMHIYSLEEVEAIFAE